MSRGIAAFLDGMVEGRERRRRWNTEDEDREWQKNRRGRQLVLDGQQDEDRLSDNAWEQEERANTRTVWNHDTQRFEREKVEWGQQDEDRATENEWKGKARGRQITVWGQDDEDRERRHEEEDYTRTRTRAADAREDEGRQVIADAWDAANESYLADNSTAPAVPDYAPAQTAQPGQSGPVAPYQPSQSPVAGTADAPPAPSGRPVNYGETVDPLPRDPATADQAPYEPIGALPVDPPNVAAPPAPARPQRRYAIAGPSQGRALAAQNWSITPGQQSPAPLIQEPKPTPPAPAPTRRLPVSTEPPERIARRAAAAGKSLMDHYREVAAPKVTDHYMRNGEIEKAEAFQKFIQTGQTQEAMGHWAQAVARAQIGDYRGFVDSLAQAYNTRGYYDDGIVALPDQTVIQQDPQTGNLSGKIVFQDEATGETFEAEFEGLDDLYRAGVGMLAPEQVFEKGWEQLSAAEERRGRLIEKTITGAEKDEDTDRILEAYQTILERESDPLKARMGEDGKPLPPMTSDEMMQEAIGTVRNAKARGVVTSPAAPAASGDVPVFVR